jgi:hypothetical protein
MKLPLYLTFFAHYTEFLSFRRLLVFMLLWPLHAFAGDGDYSPLLLLPLFFILVPLISACLAKKGQYFLTLIVLTVLWAVETVFVIYAVGRVWNKNSADTDLKIWALSAVAIPLIMILYRLIWSIVERNNKV